MSYDTDAICGGTEHLFPGDTVVISTGPYEGLCGTVVRSPDTARTLRPAVVHLPGVGALELPQDWIIVHTDRRVPGGRGLPAEREPD